MTAPVELRSDNAVGVAPAVLAALADANVGSALGYGADAVTERLRDLVRRVFDHPDAAVFPTVTGTAANAIALSTICPPWGSVICHETAHINVHEGGATSHLSGGAVLRPVPGAHGRIAPTTVTNVFAATWWGDPHHSQPSALSIVCPSDLGTLSTPDQIRALTDVARSRGLRTHLDGARLANALAALGCAPADLTWRAGVDVLSLGATKNGGMNADAIVCFDADLGEQLAFRLKRAGHTTSKMRFQSAQLLAQLEDGLWLRLAAQANRAMARLAAGLRTLDVAFVEEPEVNMLLVEIDAPTADALRAHGLLFYDIQPGVARFVTSFATTDNEVDRAIGAFRAVR